MWVRIGFLVLVLISGFLYWDYTHFYDFTGQMHLTSSTSNSFTLQNSQQKGQVKYLALGDSLSAGVGSNSPEQTFVYQFASHLSQNFNQIKVLNLSFPGATSVDVLQDQLPQAIVEQPDHITLLVGINDMHNRLSTEDFSKNFQQILTELQDKTKAKIIVINISYLGANNLLLPPLNYWFDYQTQKFNDIIFSLSKGDRIKFIDLYSQTHQQFFYQTDFYSSDLFHPSGQGYLLWGQIINAD